VRELRIATLLPTLLLSGVLLAAGASGTSPAADNGPVVQMTVTPVTVSR
jgi:hypothetical protein